MLPRRLILASLLAVSVLTAGCVKDAVSTLGELQRVRTEINKKFGEDVNVHLAQGPSLILTITYINSSLNDKTPAERGQRAEQTAQLVKANYQKIQSVGEIWVVFIRRQTRFGFFHYSEGLDVYGFDKQGQRLALPNRTGNPSGSKSASAVSNEYRYLEATNESDIVLNGLQLEGQPGGNKGLVVLPHFKVSGNVKFQKAVPPAKVSFDIASYSDKEEFEQVTPIAFIADGRTIIKTEGAFEGGNTQFCYLTVAYADFRRMIAAEQLTIKLGAKEYPLTPDQFAGLQNMIAVLKD